MSDSADDLAENWLALRRLHAELGSLYRNKSRDIFRIELLWKAIEEKEALLQLDGIDVR